MSSQQFFTEDGWVRGCVSSNLFCQWEEEMGFQRLSPATLPCKFGISRTKGVGDGAGFLDVPDFHPLL